MKTTATAKSKQPTAALAERITEALLAADDTGLTVKELSSQLGVPNSSLHVWFSTTGKKRVEIVKVGEARYAWSAAYRSTPAAPAKPKAIAKIPKPHPIPKPSLRASAPSRENSPVDEFAESSETIVKLAVWQIDPDADQHRQTFDEAKLRLLGEDMLAHGQDQPIIVQEAPWMGRKVEGQATRYKIIAGERRWRAATLVGMPMLRATIRQVDDREAMRIQAAENLQREGLNPVEEARAYRNLQDAGESPDVIQKTYGLSKSAYYGKLKMLELPPDGLQAVASGRLGESIAIDLARLEPAVQTSALERLLHENAEGLNYRDQKRLIEEIVQKATESAEWEVVVAGFRAGGCRVLTLAESKHLYVTDDDVNDWQNALDIERPKIISSVVHEDPAQRTFEQIIGQALLHKVRAEIVVARSNSGKPVEILAEARLLELLATAGFDLTAAAGKSAANDEFATDRAEREREREITAAVGAELTREVVGKVKCTSTLPWKIFIRGLLELDSDLDELADIVSGRGKIRDFDPEPFKEVEYGAHVAAFDRLWQEMQAFTNDELAQICVEFTLQSCRIFNLHDVSGMQETAGSFGIDYDAIRTRVGGKQGTPTPAIGPVKTQKAA